MAKKKDADSGYCPKCHRRTYSKKFAQCTACGIGMEQGQQTLDGADRTSAGSLLRTRTEGEARAAARQDVSTPRATPPGAFVGERPERDGVERVPEPTEGEPCPSCGKLFGKSKARRQREYRERKADGDE